MEHLAYLFAGFAVFWAGLFAYLLWLQARLRVLRRQLEHMEERLAESERRSDITMHVSAPSTAEVPSEPSGASR